jgi:hypothetical protein
VVTGVESSLAINISGSIGSKYGVVKIGTTTGEYVTSSLLPIFNDKFFGIKASREVSGSYHNLQLSVRQSEKERTIFEETKTTSISNTISVWDNGSTLQLGSGFIGSVDEFRLWSTPLDKERFYEHVSFPEMINGNSVSSSTDDLHFRLDFEYPKNLAVSQSLINVDTNIFYPLIQINPSSSLQITRNILEETGSIGTNMISSTNVSASFTATAIGFVPVTSYPYQFEAIDRSVTLEIPDLGASRYSTNKVRFESQYNLDGTEITSTKGVNLSVKSRGTKKAFDQSPTDSNRVGLFFSPTKELNIDIAKSFGGINLDNYIGNPQDYYKSN